MALTRHYKILVCGGSSFRCINETLPNVQYESGLERGFLVAPESNINWIKGRYVFTKLGKTESLDPDSLEVVEEQTQGLADMRFELDQKKGLVMVEQKRGNFDVLYEALESLPDVHSAFEELNLNLKELLFEIQGAYKKNTVKTLRIKDYLARENMLGSSSFKILEEQDAEKIAEKFDDQLEAFTLTLKLPDGPCSLSVNRKGTVRSSDDMPDEVLMFVKDLIPQFHEAEVETTEVHSPVAAR